MEKCSEDFIALLVLVSHVLYKANIVRPGALYPNERVFLKLLLLARWRKNNTWIIAAEVLLIVLLIPPKCNFSSKCVFQCAWEVRTSTVQHQEHLERLHLWGIFILIFISLLYCWEKYIFFYLRGSLCCVFLAMWLGENNNLWLKEEWHFSRKTLGMAWKTGRPTVNSAQNWCLTHEYVWLAMSLLCSMPSVKNVKYKFLRCCHTILLTSAPSIKIEISL